jgi:gamma-glutamyltranspeptidase/glutathione hydrolase
VKKGNIVYNVFIKKEVTSLFYNNPYYNPYPSKRNVVYARNGVVATSQPLAAQAGLDILKKGGNAIDAAIATAACLTVVEPTSNGIGGDAFAIVWFHNQMHGLNASGVSPSSISIEKLKNLGLTEIPKLGLIPVMVPGIPSAWRELSDKFGKLSLFEVLQPAIDYAKNGYPLSPTLAYYWNIAYKYYKNNCITEEFQPWFDTFIPNGVCPSVGEMWKSQDHAKTLELIGKTKANAFYHGELADQIDAFSQKHQGFIRKSDLKTYQPTWVNPISINYKGYQVWEIPPNGQGIIALEALNIVKELQLTEHPSLENVHKQIEAMKLAFADGLNYITDPKMMKLSSSDLLNEEYAKIRRSQITNFAGDFVKGNPPSSGTVYLATADQEGNMVSYIQSNYMGFGSGIVVPHTGIALQNRGHNFSFDPTHDNALGPNKKTLHTIIPGFLTKGEDAIGPFGVMGGFMQPQGHMQVIMNTIDYKLNPQAALDSPRWQWLKQKQVVFEPNFNQDIVKGLIKMGHEATYDSNIGSFGRGQIIWRNPKTKVYVAGTESRTDGSIASY